MSMGTTCNIKNISIFAIFDTNELFLISIRAYMNILAQFEGLKSPRLYMTTGIIQEYLITHIKHMISLLYVVKEYSYPLMPLKHL